MPDPDATTAAATATDTPADPTTGPTPAPVIPTRPTPLQMAAAKQPDPPTTKYVALVGLDYWSPDGSKPRHVEPGEVVDDIPEGVVENWKTINPPAIREATADDLKGGA